MNRSGRSIVGAAAVVALIGAAGCVRQPRPSAIAPPSIERQSLAALPALTLPPPATQPQTPVPLNAIIDYAVGRDALLRGDRAKAVDQFTKVINGDGESAVVWQDLGIALVGRDNGRALAAFRRALAYAPDLLTSRIYSARLLVDRGEHWPAIEELRYARLSPLYASQPVDAAVVDLLLGRLLEEQGYAAAAGECYARVLPVIESRPIELRTQPELSELVLRPNVLRLRMADMAAKAGKPGEAIEYYRRLIEEEPGAAPVLRLRVAAVLANSGNLAGGAAEALSVVDQFNGSRASLQAYIDLFASHGGDRVALDYVTTSQPAPSADLSARAVLAARLERRLGQPDAAVRRLNTSALRYTGAFVREIVAAHRDAGQDEALLRRLLEMMTAQPAAWPQVGRGWRILTQPAQPRPLRESAIEKLEVPNALEPAKAFVIASVAQETGKPVVARRYLAVAAKANSALLQQWMQASAGGDEAADVDAASDRDVALFIEEFENEPPALAAGIGLILKQGAKQRLIDALQAALQRGEPSVSVVGPLVTILSADDQKPEALRWIEQTAGRVKSAGELYYLSSLLTQLSEPAAAERLLRTAHVADPNNAAVCNDLGYTLVEAGRDRAFAEALLWKAAGLEPDNPAYIDSVGWMLYKRGQFDEALDYLDRAVKASDPADPVVLDHAADAAYRLGKTDQAVAHWKAAVEAIRRGGGSADPQLRLRIDLKLQQIDRGQPVQVAPADS